MPNPKRKNTRPIGVFDSGLGGLTVVRELRRKLPHENIVYFGDLARLPYGIKSKEQIQKFSIQNSKFLLKKKVKAIVVACNSSASTSFKTLQNHFALPFVDVIEPAVTRAVEQTRNGRIGLIATQATIESKSYQKRLKKNGKKVKIYSQACPLFVPLVEEGMTQGDIATSVAKKYLKQFKNKKIDTLILGCTHYPLLKSLLQKLMGKKVKIIDSAKPTVDKLASLLEEKGLNYSAKTKGKLRVFVSDKPRNFRAVGEKFLGEKLNSVKVIRV